MRSSTTVLASLSILATAASAFVVPQGNELQDRSYVEAYQNEMRRREIIGVDGLEPSYGESRLWAI